jgi:hypothetical protein
MSDRQEAAIDRFLLRFVAGVVLPRRRSRRPVEDGRRLFVSAAPDWPLTRLQRAPPHAPCSTRCPGRNWTRRGTPGHLLQPEAEARRRPPGQQALFGRGTGTMALSRRTYLEPGSMAQFGAVLSNSNLEKNSPAFSSSSPPLICNSNCLSPVVTFSIPDITRFMPSPFPRNHSRCRNFRCLSLNLQFLVGSLELSQND